MKGNISELMLIKTSFSSANISAVLQVNGLDEKNSVSLNMFLLVFFQRGTVTFSLISIVNKHTGTVCRAQSRSALNQS